MNELEIQVLGMSRSGNHAICNWIFRQAKEPKLLLNCAEGKTDPFDTCRPFSSAQPGWRQAPDPHTAPEARAQRALLMHSYEDSWFGHAFSRELEAHHDAWLGPSRRRIRLLILRDPYNLFASRLKMGAALSTHVSRTMWKQHAREALGDTRKIKDKIVVLYNQWADKDYRRDTAEEIGLKFTDAGANQVPQTTGGSSFDGTSFDGRAAEMARHKIGGRRMRRTRPNSRSSTKKWYLSPRDFSDRCLLPWSWLGQPSVPRVKLEPAFSRRSQRTVRGVGAQKRLIS